MWGWFALILVLLLVWWVSRPTITKQYFQESCQLQSSVQLPPEQVQALITHTTEQINQEVARYTDPVKMGMVTVKGIGNARLSGVTMGPQSQVLPCTSSCTCQKGSFFSQGATLKIVGGTASVLAPNVEVTFLGGLGRVTTTVAATVRGVDATIETDCRKGLVVTSLDLQEVEITQPAADTTLGKLLARVPQQKEQLLEGLRNYVVGKVLQLPTSLADTPLLCKAIKE